MRSLVEVVTIVLGVTVLVTAALQALLVLAAIVELRLTTVRSRHRLWNRTMNSPLVPRVTVLVPAYNEEVTIRESLRGILALTYQNLEIVVVNDGSTDGTQHELSSAFDLSGVHAVYQSLLPTEDIVRLCRSGTDPRLLVAEKVNGGKADALNMALNLASGELVCAVDADTLITPDALQKLVAGFVDDPEVVASGGSVRLTNGGLVRNGKGMRPRFPRQIWAACQVVEYTRAFLIGRLGWNRLGGNLIVSGAFGVFRRDRVVEAGGYRLGSMGEDMELIVRLRRRGYEEGSPAKVLFNAEPVAWTEAPERLSELGRQRNRWYRGLLDVLVTHRRMILRPSYRSAGLLALPYFLVVEALAPVIEALGIVIFVVALLAGLVTEGQLFFVCSMYGLGLLVSLAILVLDDIAFGLTNGFRVRLHMVAIAVVEHVVFRPLTLWWRLGGLYYYTQGRGDWGAQVRRGFGPHTQPTSPLPSVGPVTSSVTGT